MLLAMVLFGCQSNHTKMMKWYENLRIGQSKESVVKSIPDYIPPDDILFEWSMKNYSDCISIDGPLPAFLSPACLYSVCFADDTLVYKGFNN